MTELLADPALGVPDRDPESVLDCAPLLPPPAPGMGRAAEDILLVSGLLGPPCGLLLAAADALCSSFLNVSGVDDLVGDSSDGMEARLDSLLCACLALLFFLGVSGVVDLEEMEKVALEEGFLPPPPAVEGLVEPVVGRGSVEEELLALVLGLPKLESRLLLLGMAAEASSPPLLRKERSCGIMAEPRSLPPPFSNDTNCEIISRLSGSLTSLSLATMAS